MKNTKLIFSYLCSLTLMVGFTACSAGDEESEQVFNDTVRSSSYFEQEPEVMGGTPSPCANEQVECEQDELSPGEEAEEEFTQEETHVKPPASEGAQTTEVTIDQTYRCRSERYRTAAGYDELFLLNPTVDVIYPGAILDGNSIPSGGYRPINAIRQPLRISASIRGAAAPISADVEGPSLSTVSEAINTILSVDSIGDLIPTANSVLSLTNVASSTGFSLAAGVNIMAQVSPTFQAGLGLSFDFSSEDTRQDYLARFIQQYYTVAVDLPANPADFFEEFPEIPAGVSPVYVSSVTYGRMILFNLHSHDSEIRVNAALEASISAQGKLDLEASLEAGYHNVLTNLRLDSTIIGGAGDVCNGVTTVDAIEACITEGGDDYRDGLPVSYTLRFLSDNSIARVVLTSEYTSRQCEATGSDIVPEYEDLAIQLRGISSSGNDTEAFSTGDLELAGKIAIRPTDEGIGNSGINTPCDPTQAGFRKLLKRGRNNNLPVGSSMVDLSNQNLNASFEGEEYRVVPKRQNLEICVRVEDQEFLADTGNTESSINYSQIISVNSEHIGQGETAPVPLRFISSDHGDVFIDLYLYKNTNF